MLTVEQRRAIIKGVYIDDKGQNWYRSDKFHADELDYEAIKFKVDFDTIFYIDEEHIISSVLIDKNMQLGYVTVQFMEECGIKQVRMDDIKIINGFDRPAIINIVLKTLYESGTPVSTIAKIFSLSKAGVIIKLKSLGVYKEYSKRGRPRINK
jgi:hypothetical protein